MDIEIYFEPISLDLSAYAEETINFYVGNLIDPFTKTGQFPDLKETKIAIFGVKEDRKSLKNIGCAEAPDKVREQLYPLLSHWNNVKIADLGNIRQGNSIEVLLGAPESLICRLNIPAIVSVLSCPPGAHLPNNSGSFKTAFAY